jgi:hypothetical protein
LTLTLNPRWDQRESSQRHPPHVPFKKKSASKIFCQYQSAHWKKKNDVLRSEWFVNFMARPHPMAAQVFSMMAGQAVDPDIGVFFCGAAVIGADLLSMCQKYTKGGITFSLHKENF